VEVPDGLDFEAPETGVALDVAVNGQATAVLGNFVVVGREEFPGAFVFDGDEAGGLFEDVAVETIREGGDGAGDEAGAAAQAEFGAEGAFGA
jgi:hypothetical protein